MIIKNEKVDITEIKHLFYVFIKRYYSVVHKILSFLIMNVSLTLKMSNPKNTGETTDTNTNELSNNCVMHRLCLHS